MLRGIALGRVTEEWDRDLQGRPILTIMKSLYESGHNAFSQIVHMPPVLQFYPIFIFPYAIPYIKQLPHT
jgi:hypothetical protein